MISENPLTETMRELRFEKSDPETHIHSFGEAADTIREIEREPEIEATDNDDQDDHENADSKFSETTVESEDPLHEIHNRKPALKAYDKKKNGGLLYAFLELKKCPLPSVRPISTLHKAESYNEAESNFQVYQKAIVNVGLTGLSRHPSTQVPVTKSTSSLSEAEYQRILELKNKRMQGIFKRAV